MDKTESVYINLGWIAKHCNFIKTVNNRNFATILWYLRNIDTNLYYIFKKKTYKPYFFKMKPWLENCYLKMRVVVG